MFSRGFCLPRNSVTTILAIRKALHLNIFLPTGFELSVNVKWTGSSNFITHKLKCWVVSVKSSVFLWDLCKTDPLWHMVLHFSLPVWNCTNIPADTANMWGRPRPAGDQAKMLRLVSCMKVPLKYWCYWEEPLLFPVGLNGFHGWGCWRWDAAQSRL